MGTRPGWQVDDCPQWCAIEHRESDHPDDRTHRSVAPAVPVITRGSVLTSSGVLHPVETDEFEVGMSRADGDHQTWLYIGSGPGAEVELSLESAILVHRAIGLRLASLA